LGVPQFWLPPPNRVESRQLPFSAVTLHDGARGHVRASGELGDEWALIGDDGKIQDAPDWIRRIRKKDDPNIGILV
jgi:hypothetical protein